MSCFLQCIELQHKGVQTQYTCHSLVYKQISMQDVNDCWAQSVKEMTSGGGYQWKNVRHSLCPQRPEPVRIVKFT